MGKKKQKGIVEIGGEENWSHAPLKSEMLFTYVASIQTFFLRVFFSEAESLLHDMKEEEKCIFRSNNHLIMLDLIYYLLKLSSAIK